MDATKAHTILCNIAVICVGTMAIGLFFYRHIRQSTPSQSFAMPGKVKTDPYHLMDLVAATLLITLLLSPLIAVATSTPEAPDAAQSASQGSTEGSVSNAMSIALFSLVLGICVFLFASVLRGMKPSIVFGLSRLHPFNILLWATITVLLAYPLMIGIAILQEAFLGSEEQLQKVVKTLLETEDTKLKIILIATATIVAPLVEEIIFRGYLYAVIKRYSSRTFAAITISLLFAVVHNNLPGMMPLFILALMLTLAYELTGCLWVPMVAHALFNTIQVFVMLNLQNG